MWVQPDGLRSVFKVLFGIDFEFFFKEAPFFGTLCPLQPGDRQGPFRRN